VPYARSASTAGTCWRSSRLRAGYSLVRLRRVVDDDSGDGVDEDGSKARRRVEEHFDYSSLVRVLGVAVRRLCRYIEFASQLDCFCVGVADL
jgi:hypothetical protein